MSYACLTAVFHRARKGQLAILGPNIWGKAPFDISYILTFYFSLRNYTFSVKAVQNSPRWHDFGNHHSNSETTGPLQPRSRCAGVAFKCARHLNFEAPSVVQALIAVDPADFSLRHNRWQLRHPKFLVGVHDSGYTLRRR